MRAPGGTHLQLALRLDIFAKVGGDGLVELVQHPHGEHGVDVSGLDEFVECIGELHTDAVFRKRKEGSAKGCDVQRGG